MFSWGLGAFYLPVCGLNMLCFQELVLTAVFSDRVSATVTSATVSNGEVSL